MKFGSQCFCLITWLICFGARAENLPFSAVFNQLKEGQYCGYITYADIQNSGFRCSEQQKKINRPTWVLEHLVFSEAAKKQILVDSCLSESFEALISDENLRAEYVGDVARSWLGYKKAQLIRNRCQAFFNAFVPKQTKINEESFQKLALAFEKKPVKSLLGFPATPSDLKILPHCLNWDLYKSLQLAETIYSGSLPLHGSLEPLKFIEKNRKLITNVKTQKPLTDDEILSLDLAKATENVTVDFEDFARPTNDLLTSFRNERAGIVNEIKSRIAAGGFSPSVKDYLAESGAVKEVMLQHKMIEVDKSGKITKSSKGAVCINSWNDVTRKSKKIDFAASFLIPGALGFKALSSANKGRSFSNLATASLMGLDSASHALFTSDVAKKCLSGANTGATGNRQLQKTEDSERTLKIDRFRKAFHFYDEFFVEVDPKRTPSCQAIKDFKDKKKYSVFLQKQASKGCLVDALELILPTL